MSLYLRPLARALPLPFFADFFFAAAIACTFRHARP
jgi:hypothetical protein